MRIETLVAPLLSTSCHVVLGEGTCVVVDPGAGVLPDLTALVDGLRLTPVAVVLTHGHVDHTWSAAAVQERWDVPVLVHEADRYRLTDPFGSLGPLGAQLATAATGLGEPYREPAHIRAFAADGVLDLGDRAPALRSRHAPGHTEGSTVLLGQTADGPVALTGDVLFRGTIGRTDLPGGDTAAMQRTLRDLATLDPATVVLPGHGPGSTIATELRTNPYLR